MNTSTSPKKRVLFISPSLSKGGAETQLLKVAQFLKANDFEVMIISLKPINEFDLDFTEMGIRVEFLKSWFDRPAYNWTQLKKMIADFAPQHVIAFMFIAILFARMLKIRLDFKLISSIRTSVIHRKWYVPYKLSMGMDDVLVFNSKASKANFERLKLARKGGLVIHNAISIPDLSAVTCRPRAVFTWVCVAHFRWNKDYVTLFEAIALLKPGSFRLEIIGELNEETWPHRMILELGIQNYVRILGFKQNAAEYLKAADAFVLSSHYEGMPNAILEAMAYGKPVVATAIDCNKEFIEAAGCGMLSEPLNARSLADQMKKMMYMSPTGRYTLGQNGKKYIESHFSEQQILNQWMELIVNT